MIETRAYPLDDFEYLAEDLRKWNYVYTTGVFPEENQLKTTTNNDMSVTVSSGFILLNDGNGGLMQWLATDEPVQIATAHGSLHRIDAITMQWDKVNNTTNLYSKLGSPSATPTAPIPQRDETMYEAIIATVYVPAGSTVVASGNITDKRPDPTVCGYIESRVKSIPTEMIQAQFEELIEQYKKDIEDIGTLTIPDGSVSKEKLHSDLVGELIVNNGGVLEDGEGNQYGLIDTGTSGPLTYYKYADGRLTYVVNGTTTATITAVYGGLYRSALRSMASYIYPIPFVAIPTITATVGGNGHGQIVWIAISDNLALYDAPPDFVICSGEAISNSLSYRVGMIVEGRWK